MSNSLGRLRAAFIFILLADLTACGGGDGPSAYSVGGTVSGLAANSSLTITDGGSGALIVSTNGAFTFKTPLAAGTSYAAVITAAPALQACTVTNGTGTVSSAAVSSIAVNCVGPFSVGGHVSGLSPNASLTIIDNGTDVLTVSANGSFTFSTSLKPGASYAAAISALPSGEKCGLTGSSGTVATSSYTGISITCAIPTLGLVAGALGGSGSNDGNRTTARLYNPTDVVADAAGNLYVADDYNALVRKMDVSGNVTTLAGKARQMGTADGTGPSAQFENPSNIRWAGAGSLYLTDNASIRNITPAGVVTTVYTGSGQFAGLDVSQPGIVLATDLTNKTAVKIDLTANTVATIATGFENPVGIALAAPSSSAAGTTYVADEFAATLEAISTTGMVSTLAGKSGVAGYADGTGSAAQFYLPTYMSLNGAGNILIADMGANTIRQATPAGVVTTIAGPHTKAGSADCAASTARFNYPTVLVADAAGNLYVGDSNGIREVTTTGQVSTPFSEGGVSGLAPDGKGNFYFTRFPNDSIQRIASDGTVSVIAGSQYAGFADGTGAAAGFNQPHGLAVDSSGNLIVADTGNATIRMITPAGVVTTLAGSQTSGSSDGAGAAALFNGPTDIAIGPSGEIFVSDSANHTIREISATGVVTTLAGIAGEAGVKLGPLPTTLNVPAGLAYVGSTLYVVEEGENSVLSISGVF